MKKVVAALIFWNFLIPSAFAADIKVGFVTTLTTPAAVIGNDMKNAVNLALKHLGSKAGTHNIEVVFGDDGFAPDTGKQVTDRLLKQDKVDIIAGYIWSHVLLASRKSVLDAGKILISSNAGPSQMAGKLCHENFFSASWQNNQTPMAMGEVFNREGIKSLYIMAPNYAAGKDMVAGIERTFNGQVIGKDLTKWGADAQLDFSAELAKAKVSGADGLFVFYPGAASGAFTKQYHQAGLKDLLPLYSVFTIDGISLPKLQAANFSGIVGSKVTQQWDPSLNNQANKKFVTDFKEQFGKYPSFYAAQSNTINMIASAIMAVDGDMNDMAGLRSALKSANYNSLRGKYSYGNNNFPIQNFYLREVVEDSDGNWTTEVVDTVFTNHQDPFAAECKLK